MITARHNPIAQVLFDRYIMRLMRRSFHAAHLIGDVPELKPDKPLLLMPNHNSWWDGFFIHLLNKHSYNRKIYIMMLEEQLRKYWFFRSVGAYSIDPGKPRSVIESLEYTSGIMKQEGGAALFCLFPQGELLPYGAPLNYERGYKWIVKRSDGAAILLPLAMKVEQRIEQRPEVFFLFGNPIDVSSMHCPDPRFMVQMHTTLMATLDDAIRNGSPSRNILHGYSSLPTMYDSLQGKQK
jgi:1-acyl-sn-glycerol-3-phosphate acyltransferase